LAGDHLRAIALAVGAGTLVYGCAGLLLAEAWRRLLGPGVAPARPRHYRAMYGRTQIAKYLPGNCFHFVGRQVLGRRLGHAHGALALASLAEAALLLLTAGALALQLLWCCPAWTSGAPPAWPALAVVGLAIVLLLARRSGDGLTRALRQARGALRSLASRLVPAALLYAAFFILAGLILWGLAAASQAPGEHTLGLATAVSALAMAWCLGFVVPGSSAGIGVREAVLVLTLEQHLAADGALLVALALRLITTLGDLVFFAFCLATPLHDRPTRSPAPQSPA
jgi:glycosyltransferase 2 family protein